MHLGTPGRWTGEVRPIRVRDRCTGDIGRVGESEGKGGEGGKEDV